jgi:hypothetical protein
VKILKEDLSVFDVMNLSYVKRKETNYTTYSDYQTIHTNNAKKEHTVGKYQNITRKKKKKAFKKKKNT